jgi:lipopolysaccharide heptosyltransferase II
MLAAQVQIPEESIRRILVIQFRPIGDVLLSTPLVHALRDHWPQAFIAFLTEKIPGEVLRHNPHLDEVIEYRKESVLKSYRFFTSLRRYKFDLAIDLRCTTGTAGAAYLCGAPYRVGYVVRPPRSYAYNLPTENNMTEERYTALKKQILIKRCGVQQERSDVVYTVSDEERTFAQAYLSSETDGAFPGNVPLVCLSPTSKRQSRRWRLAGYAELADRLIAEEGAVVVALSGPNETDFLDEMETMMHRGPLLRPRTTVRQATALIEASDILMGNDNGLRHLATAVGTPTVAVFGPGSPTVWSPPDKPQHQVLRGNVACLGCSKTDCSHHSCMADVSATEVLEVVRETLAFNPAA